MLEIVCFVLIVKKRYENSGGDVNKLNTKCFCFFGTAKNIPTIFIFDEAHLCSNRYAAGLFLLSNF